MNTSETCLRTTAMIAAWFCILASGWTTPAVAQNRWVIDRDGGITWNVEPQKAHRDHIEMSGRKLSVIVSYGVDEGGRLAISRQVVFPMLRFVPNKTRDHLALVFAEDAAPRYFIDQAAPRGEVITRVHHKGIMRIESVIGRNREVSLVRTIFPSIDKPLLIEGFDTYRYYEGNTVLRAWICIPLTTGILERKAGTIAALFSPRLWTEDGLATQAGEKTFWDRSTLYALRGVFAAGETRKALDYLRYYSNRRLLGEHVPYPVEAYPEGNQRHLSAESALYCRIYTEGLFGIRPTGLTSFDCTPRLPDGWDVMKLRNIEAFGATFDLEVSRAGDKLQVQITRDGKALPAISISHGETASIRFQRGVSGTQNLIPLLTRD